MSKNPFRTKSLIQSFEGLAKNKVTSFDSGTQSGLEKTPPPTEIPPVVRMHSSDDQRMKPLTQTAVKRKVLIVLAHWERNSFNGALLDTAVATLTGQGHEVTVSDLYAQGFNPLLSRNDIQDGPRDPDKFNYAVEAGLAFTRGALAPDVLAEQEKLTKADLVIFQFPLNWASVPVMLKGYFDRVLVQNFAYKFGEWFDKGKLKGKRAILSITTGSMDTVYSPEGFMGDMNVILWPLQNCVLRFCGWDVLSPNICFSPGYSSDSARQSMLDAWKERLSKDLWTEEPLRFIPIENFDPATGRLLDDVLRKTDAAAAAAAADGVTGEDQSLQLPIGQHAGRRVTPQSMYRPPRK